MQSAEERVAPDKPERLSPLNAITDPSMFSPTQHLENTTQGFSNQVGAPTDMARPVQIVRPKNGSGFEICLEAVKKVLQADNVRDKPAVVVSVAGAPRSGKSFLLNMFLKYLRSNSKEDWLSDRRVLVEGFPWKGGSKRYTTGIWLWNEAFLVKTSQGDEVAVLLMDTQGMFDSDTAIQDCVKMFSFSAFISSVQIYNITQNIQEDHLHHLLTCVEYGRMALAKDCTETLFQNLLLVVRDWNFPSDAPYGEKGGKKILNKWLKTHDGQPLERKSSRESIRSAFWAIDCILLPYPGRKVASATSTEGRPCELEDDFRENIKDLVRSVLDPDSLVLKRDCGRETTCEALYSLMEASWEALNTQIHEPTSPLQEHIGECTPAEVAKRHWPQSSKEMMFSLLSDHTRMECHKGAVSCPICGKGIRDCNFQGAVDEVVKNAERHLRDTVAAITADMKKIFELQTKLQKEAIEQQKMLQKSLPELLRDQTSGLLESLLPTSSAKEKIN